MDVITVLHANLSRLTCELKKGFQVTSEGETLILKKNTADIHFDKKMENKAGKKFLLTTKFYKSANDAALLAPQKRKPEGKAAIQPEGTATKKQENTKKNATRKIHAKKLHAKIGYPGKYMMYTTVKHLHYSVERTLEVCEECTMGRIKYKWLNKVAEYRELKPVKMIYLDLSSQKKPSYGGSNNWILVQDSNTKQKWYFFT